MNDAPVVVAVTLAYVDSHRTVGVAFCNATRRCSNAMHTFPLPAQAEGVSAGQFLDAVMSAVMWALYSRLWPLGSLLAGRTAAQPICIACWLPDHHLHFGWSAGCAGSWVHASLQTMSTSAAWRQRLFRWGRKRWSCPRYIAPLMEPAQHSSSIWGLVEYVSKQCIPFCPDALFA